MPYSIKLPAINCSQAVKQCCTLIVCAFLFGCGSTEEIVAPAPVSAVESTAVQINELLARADASFGVQATGYRLEAADSLLAENSFSELAEVLASIQNIDNAPKPLQIHYALLQAQMEVNREDSAAALRWLTGSLATDADPATETGAHLFVLLGDIYTQNTQTAEALLAYVTAAPYFEENSESDVYEKLWRLLQSFNDDDLGNFAAGAASYDLRGWVELERVYRADEFNIRSQLDAIAQWQRIWSSHPAARRLPLPLAELQEIWTNRPQHIGLILPVQQQSGITIQEGFFSAYYEALGVSREVPKVTVIDSSSVTSVAEVYEQAIDANVDLIIGPLDKSFVNEIASRDALPVPTLALNYADDPALAPENLYQFGLAPQDEIRQLASLAWQEGHRNVAVVSPQSDDYSRLQSVFRIYWEELGGQIVSATTFSDTNDYSDTVKRLMAIDSSEARAARILDLLPRNNIEFVPRRRQDIDFIFLMANPRQGRLIKPTLAFYFAEDVPVFSMPSIYEGVENPAADRELNGVWFAAEPWVLQATSDLKNTVNSSLRPATGPLQRLRALGIDAFRLYARLNQLETGKLMQLPGTTGLLSMSPTKRIQRQLEIARFINGQAVEQLSTASNSD